MDMVSKYRQSGKEMKPFRSDFSFFQTASIPSLPCFVSLYHEKCGEVNIFFKHDAGARYSKTRRQMTP